MTAASLPIEPFSFIAEIAIGYARRGWSVFPLKPGSKEPYPGTQGFKDASNNEHTIRLLFQGKPDANIGIATGSASGIWVLDVDKKSGGVETLTDLIEKNGPLPQTLGVHTPTGGFHFYFTYDPKRPKRSRANIAPGLDIRADGGYIVAPPSVHPNGGKYLWAHEAGDAEASQEPTEAAAWLETIANRTRHQVGSDSRTGKLLVGSRHVTLMSRAGTLRNRGKGYDEIKAELMALLPDLGDFPLHELDRIARDASQYPTKKNLTDLGNAERLLARHGSDLRHANGDWFIWDGARFKKDNTGRIFALTKETVRSILAEAAEEHDDKRRTEVIQWAKLSESVSRIRAMVELASKDPHVSRSMDDFDMDHLKLNVKNGTIDLRTGYLTSHSREDDHTKIAPVEYDPNATCPQFDAFLTRVMPDESLRGFLWRFIGYTLTGTAKEEKMLLLHGTGANGKSTLIETIRHVMGDYAVSSGSDILVVQKYDDTTGQAIARLAGARFVTVDESAAGSKLDAEKVKTLTSPNRRTARFLYRDAFEFTITHKLWMATNHPPESDAQDDALTRRLWPFEFAVVIPEHERDPDLAIKLQQEAPGILARAVREAVTWQARGLDAPETLRKQKSSFIEERDTVTRFVAERCELGGSWKIRAGDLYTRYIAWAKENREMATSRNLFGTAIRRIDGVEPYTANKGVRMYRGIGIDQGGFSAYGQ